MGLTWHQKTMGVCLHGWPARPYCAVCVMEDKAEAKRLAEEKREGSDRKRLERVVAEQSAALDGAYAYIRRLERKQRS